MPSSFLTPGNVHIRLEQVLSLGASMLQERGAVSPILHGFPSLSPGRAIVYACNLSTPETRRASFDIARALFQIYDVRDYILLTETWMPALPMTVARSEIVLPVRDANQIEAVHALYVGQAGALTGYREFRRGHDGSVAEILPPTIHAEPGPIPDDEEATLLDPSRVDSKSVAYVRKTFAAALDPSYAVTH